MEAVPATSGARRTVRLAAALVAGQILLVAIVGWVTLTRGDSHPARGAAAIDQLAAPPVHPSPAGVSPAPPATRNPPAATKTGDGPRSSSVSESRTSAAPRGRPHTTPGTPGSQARKPAPAPLPTTSASSAPLSLLPTSSPAATPPPASPSASPSVSAAPVEAGRPCDVPNAVARTGDGRTVRCLPTRSHGLRWKIV